MKKKEKIKETRKSPRIINNSGKGSSKRGKTKERVWDNASILEALVNNSSEVFLLFDMNRSLQYVSPSFETLTGYKAASLGKRQFIHYFHPEDNERMLKVWEAVFHGKEYSGQFRIVIKHKAIKWCSALWKPVRDRRGRQIGVLLNAKDITDFKMNEKTLPESEAKYGTILETMEEGLYEIDLRGNYTFVNDAGCRQMGYSCRELTGMNYRNISTPETSRKLYEIFHRIYETGKPEFLMDYDVIRKDGSIRTHQSNAALMKDPSGQPIGFFNLARDVTERKKKVVQHRLREERYRNILDTMEETYFEVDLNGNLVFFSAALIRNSGYTNEEVMGMNFRKFMDREHEQKVFEAFHRVFLTGEIIKGFGWELITKKSEKIAVESSIILRKDESGKPVGFRGVMRDVTQRKEAEEALRRSEERYRTVLETMNEGYFENDLKGNFTFENDAAHRLVGYERDELIGLNYQKIHSPEVARFLKEVYTRIYQTGKPEFLAEYKIVRKDGSIRTHQLNAALVKDPSGQPTGFRNLVRDVTERKITEEALRISEEKYRNILDTMEEGLFEMNLRGNFTFVNDAACRLMGYEREEMIGKNYRMMNHLPETERRLFEVYNRIYKTGEPAFLLDYDSTRKDGSVRFFQTNAMLIRDISGQPIGFRSLARDVTERKKAEDALGQSEEKYRTILETMEEGLFESDLTGAVTFVNDAACKLMGYEREELIGMDYHKIYAPDIVKDVFKIYNNIYKTGKPALFLDYKVIRKDGSICIHEANASLRRNHSGEAIGFRVLVRDVTERRKAEDVLRQKEEALRQSEEKYRIIAENVYDVIWTVDLNETVTYVSPSISAITGYTPEEIQNKQVKEIITLESYAIVEKMLAEEFAKEKTPADPRGSRTLELELIKKNSSTAWVEASATFIRDEHLHVKGILGVARDISERKQAEKEKTRLEEQLVQAQKMESVGRLAGGVAHDFNNMLSVILGYVDLIKLNLPQSDSLFKDVLEIERAASRSRDITRELLAFSRKQIITPMPLDLNLLIESTTMTLSRLIGEDIDLRFYPGNDLWNIKFDPSQVEQILVNLAANARDAMPYGGKLTIETENTYLNEDYCSAHVGFTSGYYVLLGVSDNGVGMNKETLQHAFEPFYTTKETGRGTGLGLATVYGIVKQNGGFINPYSEPGKGTAFKIYIPRSMEEGAAPEESETAILATGSGTVLLVEDDEMVRNMITEMLEAIGYTVQATGNPLEALSMIQKNNSNIDLMLTDVVMPGMSGKELRERIEIVRPGIRVLFMSGYSSNVIAHHGVLDEGVHFIQKPFSMIDLARKVLDAIKDK